MLRIFPVNLGVRQTRKNMSDYSHWEFMLDGAMQEFRQFSTQPCTALFNIYGGVDHWLDCPNDDFRMTTLYCEGEDDPRIVWQIGYELISLFNGASILFDKNYPKASIFKLLHDEREVNYVAREGSTGLLGKPPFPQVRLNKEFKNAKGSSIKLQLIHLATENKDAYFILKYLDMEVGWITYYKLLEAIEHFIKEKAVNLALEKNKRTAFTNTANNFSLSGFDSRHGFKDVIKKNNTPSMKIEEAHELITGLAKKYLKLIYFK